MSWAVNQGPSFDNQRHAYQKLSGFYNRFNLLQDDNRMTPGKREPHLRKQKMTGRRPAKQPGQVKYSDSIPQDQPEPIYRGFSNIKNKATTKIKKKGGKLKVRKIK